MTSLAKAAKLSATNRPLNALPPALNTIPSTSVLAERETLVLLEMAKVAVSEALMRVADRCVQVMGGSGVTDDTIVEQVFREVRAFRIYDGPTEVHKWSLARKIKRDWKAKGA